MLYNLNFRDNQHKEVVRSFESSESMSGDDEIEEN